MLEHIIKNHLLHYKQFFTSRQHGFHPYHSCVTQLIQVMEDWTSVLQPGHQVHVVYLDLQKAFDGVPHVRLISKVRSYRVNSKLLQWTEDFLANRKQQVCLIM